MKKKIIIIAVFICLIGSLAAQEQTDWQQNGLHGKVKKITETAYELREYFGEWIKGEVVYKKVQEYSINGYLTRVELPRSSFDFNLEKMVYKSVDIITYNYNEKGNLVEETKYDSDGLLKSKSTYDYDNEGKQLVQYYYFEGSLLLNTFYSYDKQGKLVEKNNYLADGSLSSKTIYIHDTKGYHTELADYNSEGIIQRKSFFTYDKRGNMTEQVIYDAKGMQKSKYKHAYNSKDYLIEFSSSGSTDKIDWLVSYTYNEKDFVTSSVKHDYLDTKDVETLTYSYEYDEMNNAIVRTQNTIVTKFGKTYLEPNEIVLREITYY